MNLTSMFFCWFLNSLFNYLFIYLFVAHLISQNASLRSDAVVVVENLSKQCSDAVTVEYLLKHLLKVLAGMVLKF